MKRQDSFEPLPELAPDLEWMLQSGQIGPELLSEALVEAYYDQAVALGSLYLNDGEAAHRAAVEALSSALANRYLYRGKEDVQVWVYQFVLEALKAEGRKRIGEDALWATLPPAAGSTGLTAEDVGPWLLAMIASLADRQRLPLLLRFACQWPEERIADLLRLTKTDVHRSLQATLLRMAALLNDSSRKDSSPVDEAQADQGISSIQDLERLLRSILPGCEDAEAGETYQEVARSVFDRARRRTLARGRFLRIKEAVLVAATTLAVAGVLWVANSLLPGDELTLTANRSFQTADGSSSRTTSTPEEKAVPTRAPVPVLPVPLSPSSSPMDVLERVTTSEQLWNTLWADVVVRQFGSSGYVGPPLEYRMQAWISQPNQRQFLIGPRDGKPVYAILTGNDIPYVFRIGDGLTRIRHEESLVNNPGIEDLLYPGRSALFQGKGQLQLLGLEKVARRGAIVATLTDTRTKFEYQVWIDAIRGILLRIQKFDIASDRSLIQESEITRIHFDVVSPYPQLHDMQQGNFFDLDSELGGDADIENEADAFSQEPLRMNRLDKSSLPPDGFIVNESDLVFQYPQNYLDSKMPAGRNPQVDLFGEGYYLGSVKFARPWHVVCRRSPDGSTIAFSDLTGWNEFLQDNWRVPRIYWFNLEDMELRTLNGDGHAHVMAFSPDSRHLAFFGTVPWPGHFSPGVYLLDTLTGENQLLLQVNRTHNLRWSQDGRFLLVQKEPGDAPAENQQVILDVNTGDVITEILFDESVIIWTPSYPGEATGLEQCASAPRG